MVKDFLRARWHRTLAIVNPPRKDGVDYILDAVLQAYSEPGRHYHTCDHLMACFQVLDRVFPFKPIDPEKPLPELPHHVHGHIELALWFHDMVYDPKAPAGENESLSINQASEIITEGLDLPSHVAIDVANLIDMTRHHAGPQTPAAKILVDVDLSILGESTETFDLYDQAIRKEFAWVPDDDYKAGRRAVLHSFLGREWVYSTPEMRKNGYEGRAQHNLRRALDRLE